MLIILIKYNSRKSFSDAIIERHSTSSEAKQWLCKVQTFYFVYKLLDKYKFNYSICNNCPQTLEIINNNMPVFTVSGTVELGNVSVVR